METAKPSGIDLQELNAHADKLRKRKEVAAEFKATDISQYGYWLGIAGLTSDFEEYSVQPLVTLRRLKQNPNIFEIANAIKEKHLLEAVSRYSTSLTHEMGVLRLASAGERDTTDTIAWWLVSAIRIHSRCDFLVPCASTAHWSHFPVLDPDGAKVVLIEDQPRARRFSSSASLGKASLGWAVDHLTAFATLLEDPRCRLAVDAACTLPQQENLRTAAMQLWSGIESLMSISHELRFRISLLVAAFLRASSAERKNLFDRMKALYDFRSKIVHGSSAKDAELVEHIIEVRGLIFEMLVKICEAGRLPTRDEYEAMIFTPAN